MEYEALVQTPRRTHYWLPITAPDIKLAEQVILSELEVMCRHEPESDKLVLIAEIPKYECPR